MLRRHLKSGGAPVAPCAGFDFEAASAYLEDALGQSHRADYESHLAGCVTCRRHLIELSRLAQTAPRAETQPVTVVGQTPARVRWREVVTGWFDLSSWNLKWQIAGAMGAAFAILIAAFGVQSWRQASKHSEMASAITTSDAAPMEPNAMAPTPELTNSNGQLTADGNSVVNRPGPLRGTVPT